MAQTNAFNTFVDELYKWLYGDGTILIEIHREIMHMEHKPDNETLDTINATIEEAKNFRNNEKIQAASELNSDTVTTPEEETIIKEAVKALYQMAAKVAKAIALGMLHVSQTAQEHGWPEEDERKATLMMPGLMACMKFQGIEKAFQKAATQEEK